MTDFIAVGSQSEVKCMLTRLVDFLKMKQITGFFTSLTLADHSNEQSEAGISSLIDCWLLVRSLEQNGERTRALYLLKSRGMAHSSQVREFLLTDTGVDLVDVCVSAGGVLTGSARREYEARQLEARVRHKEVLARKKVHLERRRRDMEAQIETLRRQFEEEEAEMTAAMQNIMEADVRAKNNRDALTRSREYDLAPQHT
jgi:circadian clock protein KaiC